MQERRQVQWQVQRQVQRQVQSQVQKKAGAGTQRNGKQRQIAETDGREGPDGCSATGGATHTEAGMPTEIETGVK